MPCLTALVGSSFRVLLATGLVLGVVRVFFSRWFEPDLYEGEEAVALLTLALPALVADYSTSRGARSDAVGR